MGKILCATKDCRVAPLQAVERVANWRDCWGDLKLLISGKRSSRILLALLVLPCSTLANATVNATGTFTGTLTSPAGTCASGYSDPANTASASFTITQSGSTFSGSGSVGHETAPAFSGSISSTGTITGSSFGTYENGVKTSDVSYSGTLSGDTLTLSGSWTDVGYPSIKCHGTFSGTLTRASSAVISAASPSSAATAPILLSTQVAAVTSAIGARIGDALRGVGRGPRKIASGFMWQEQTGLNAGDGLTNYGAWGSYSYSDFKDSLSSTALRGDSQNLLAGVDISPWENTVLGVAVGYDLGDVTTDFNKGKQKAVGQTVSVYAGRVLDKTWSIDASGGYSAVSSDQSRTAGGLNVSSKPKGDRSFLNLNLNGTTQWKNWVFGGKAGLLYAHSIQNSFSESNGTAVSKKTTNFGQFNVGGDVAYGFNNFETFAKLIYENDFSRQMIVATGATNDKDSFLLGAGLRFFGSKGMTGNVELTTRLGRDNFQEESIAATLRMDF